MNKRDFNRQWIFYKEGSDMRRTLDLPHDAMIEELRDPASPGGSAVGYFTGGVYVYEKTFDAPSDWADKHAVFQFEGVYRNSRVFINRKEAGGRPYGYIPFFVDADDFLNYGAENTIRVTVDNSQLPNSRWYTGSGVYRPVWLWLGAKTHIGIEGVKVSTLSYSPARIRIDVSHTGGEASAVILRAGTPVASGEGDKLTMEIPDARLWSEEMPELYECRVTLSENGAVVDEAAEFFGIRLVEWSAKGLFINGRETLLRGGCVHHDNGILGARSYAESEERRVRVIKQAGFNAIRVSHNPACAALLEACDKYGLYVIDETWDMWYAHKNKYDYASDFMDWYKEDIKSLVDHDFNHPSVIMYSIGNEVSEPGKEKGVALAREMTALFHSLDKNRAVTGGFNLMIISNAAKGKGMYKEDGGLSQKQPDMSGMNSTMFNMITSKVGTGMNKSANSKSADAATTPSLDALDIAGYNYGSGRYPMEGKAHPGRVIFGSETFPQDIVKNWAMVKKYPYLVGDFMWTAWDYLGENGLGAWAYTPDGKGFNKPYPWLLAEAGALDLLGNPTGEVFLAQAAWGLLKTPVIAVQPVNHPGVKPAKMVWRGTNAIPSWSWKGCEGNKALVEVYSDAYAVDLLLNDKRIGRKRVKGCVAAFTTKYTPGTLTAINRDINGNERGRSELHSALGSISIQIKPEKNTISVGDIAYINVELTGENGIMECNADTKFAVSVAGGELLAFGSANPRTPESYITGSFTTYYGRAQAVIRAQKAGLMRIAVNGNGLNPSFAEMSVIE
ncbi:MAG: DUF4982 domain-containing protein [Treponema sp.]|jgi:hypothetical protein|nr:DUF4982 domain-containing protein [Treponema sp.]